MKRALMGWFGLERQLRYALSVVGADKDEQGRYLIYNKPVTVGIDESEVVVHDETSYSVNGKRRNLARLINSNSFGVAVNVI